MNNFLLTGPRGIGKTFLVKRIIDHFSDVKMAGFFTMREENATVTLRAWDNFCLGDTGPKMVAFDMEERQVRKNVFEELGSWSIGRALNNASIIVLDELGRFEIGCSTFRERVTTAFNSYKVVIAVLKAESNPFLDGLRMRKDSFIVTVDTTNRDHMLGVLIHKIERCIKTTKSM